MAPPRGKPKATPKTATKVVEEDEIKDFTVYNGKPPTPTMDAFADWLIDEVGVEFPSKAAQAAFRDGVRLGGTLRMHFQSSEYWREDERNPRSEAGQRARASANGGPKPKSKAKAAKVAEPDEDEQLEDEVEEQPAKPARRGRAAAKPAATRKARPTSGRRGKPSPAEEADEDAAAPY